MKIGLIGNGFVGKATRTFETENNKFIVYDIKPELCYPLETSFIDICNCDIVFICLPTPMKENGEIYLDLITDTINKLNNNNSKAHIVVRSTVIPNTSKNLNVNFMPEFLTEKNYINDFINTKKWIIGYNSDNNEDFKNKITDLITDAFINKKINYNEIIFVKNSEAEMIKYFRNTFLAVKVSFCNEMYSYCQKIGLDYNQIRLIACDDERIGLSHSSVPGPDGSFGYGGTCFPKDINALNFDFNKNNVESFILKNSIIRNTTIDRPNNLLEEGRSIVYSLNQKNISVDVGDNNEKVHICMCSDKNEFVGLLTSMNSMIENSSDKSRLNFHILVGNGEKNEFNKLFYTIYDTETEFKIEVQEYKPEKFIVDNIHITNDNVKYKQRMSNVMNFSRFYLDVYFPDIGKIIYIDTDTIVQGDINYLYDSVKLDKYMFGACNCNTMARLGFSDNITKEKDFKHIDIKTMTFNAGIYMTDLFRWKSKNIIQKIKDIMTKNKKSKEKLYRFATQPILNIIFYNEYEVFDNSWNRTDLGANNRMNYESYFKNYNVLHWSGLSKPWNNDGYYKWHWTRYNKFHKYNTFVINPSSILKKSDNCYMIEIPTLKDKANSRLNGRRSYLRFFENDVESSFPNSDVSHIKHSGNFKFNHCDNYLYFSSSDNSDPRSNGKSYKYMI